MEIKRDFLGRYNVVDLFGRTIHTFDDIDDAYDFIRYYGKDD